MSEAPLVRIHDVNKYYGQNHVLKNINLSVNKGDVDRKGSAFFNINRARVSAANIRAE